MDPVLVTIYLALIVGGVFAMFMILLQVFIFIVLRSVDFSSIRIDLKIEKIKRFFLKCALIFFNPYSKLKVRKVKKI